jgi:hypothetical protein
MLVELTAISSSSNRTVHTVTVVSTATGYLRGTQSFLELVVAKIGKKFPTFYYSTYFITVCTLDIYWFQSWSRRIQYTPCLFKN